MGLVEGVPVTREPSPPVPGVSAPLSLPSPSRGLSACALPRVFHPQAAGLLQHLGPERAPPLAKPHSHLCRQSAPRGAAGGVHSGRGVAGRRLVETGHQETGPGDVAPRRWRALRRETPKPQAHLCQERETLETGVLGGALCDLEPLSAPHGPQFCSLTNGVVEPGKGFLPPALLLSPAVFKKIVPSAET